LVDLFELSLFCCLPVHWNVLWFWKLAITSTILNLNQVPPGGKSEFLSFWSCMSRGGRWSEVLCLRSEHILSTASTVTSELMNHCVCYTHLFSSGWIARDLNGSNVVTVGIFVSVVFVGIAVLLCLSTCYYTLCWNVTGYSFLWNVSYRTHNCWFGHSHSLVTFGIGAKYHLGDGASVYSVLFRKVYSAVFVYICNRSNTNSHLL